MKKLLLVAALVAASTSGLVAQTVVQRNEGDLTVLGGWDFNLTSATSVSSLNARYSTQYNPYYTAGTAPSPGDSDYGTAYFSGSNGATFGTARTTGAGSTVNLVMGAPGMAGSNDALGEAPTSASRSVLFSTAAQQDSGRATFKVSTFKQINALTTQGYENLNVAFMARNQGSADAVISWSYSLDGINFTNIAGTDNTIAPSVAAYNTFTADFSSIAALEGVSTLWLGLNYSETAAAASVFLDNVAIYGTALAAVTIPEPSTYAALLGAAVVGVSLLRRRKAALVA